MIHPGSGKTATTWLQSCFSKIPKTFYIGKDPWYNKTILYNYHKELFCSYYSKKFRSRNSSAYVKSYVNQLITLIKPKIEKDEIKNIILSDECIMGYGSYNAELNILLCKLLFSYLDKSLNEFGVVLKPSILYTIREQKSALQSIYAYDYIHQKEKSSDFEAFLNWGISNLNDDLFGGLNYYETSQIFDHVVDWPINIVPYEVLAGKGSEEYLFRCCRDINILKDDLSSISKEQKPLNVNSQRNTNFLKKPNFISTVVHFLEKNSLIKNLTKIIPKSFVKYVWNLLRSKKSTIATNTKIVFPDKLIKAYNDIYHESNLLLSSKYDINLKDYGY